MESKGLVPASFAMPAAPAPGKERRKQHLKPAAAAVEVEEEGAVTLGGREHRQLKRKKVAGSKRRHEEGEEGDSSTPTARRKTHIQRTGSNTAAPRKESFVVELPCTVRSFSEAIWRACPKYFSQALGNGGR